MRAFIALEVTEEIRRRADVLEKSFQIDGLTLVKRDAMHITMQFLGEVSVQQAERAVDSLKKISFRPFKVKLSGVSYFTPRLIRVIFVEVSQGGKELIELYTKIGNALNAAGIGYERESYKPHLTIARVKRVKEMGKLRKALEDNSKFELGTFEVRSIFMKESELRPDGPVYNDLYELHAGRGSTKT